VVLKNYSTSNVNNTGKFVLFKIFSISKRGAASEKLTVTLVAN